MLGITSEQCPKGGSLSLHAISGIAMIAVGVVGFPFIGYVQDNTASAELTANAPATAKLVLEDKEVFGILNYTAINPDKKTIAVEQQGEEASHALETATKAGQFTALAKMAIFPTFMLVCFILLFVYFQAKGGYKPVELTGGT